VDPVPGHILLTRNVVALGVQPGTFGSVIRNSDRNHGSEKRDQLRSEILLRHMPIRSEHNDEILQ
jgi:hypothetical protein